MNVSGVPRGKPDYPMNLVKTQTGKRIWYA